MTAATKAITVNASAGEGKQDPIPSGLQDFVDALRSASPTVAVRTDLRSQDLSQLNLAANMKSLQVDASTFGVTIEWNPVSFHSPDAANPAIWHTDANLRGVLYRAVYAGTDYFICVGLAT